MNNTKNILYILFFSTATCSFGMHITSTFLTKKTIYQKYSSCIKKSDKLDAIRKAFSRKNSPQDIINISEGVIRIKEQIPLGKRYGTCHNYAFTTLMGITGKAPELLNIEGRLDYYASNGINILDFFDYAPVPRQPGDIILYKANNKPLTNINQITHTARVIGDDLIESKWGAINAVFEHPTWYVPASFGNMATYYKPKITGQELLTAVQNRLAQLAVKELYDAHACEDQQYLFDLIHRRSGNADIWKFLENYMNVHVDLPDKDGITARMYAEKIGDRQLIDLLLAYATEHKN